MAVPTDPFPDFRNGIDTADGDQVDARFKALYDALNPAAAGIDNSMVSASAAIDGSKLADAGVARVKLAEVYVDTTQGGATGLRIRCGQGQAVPFFDAARLAQAITHNLGRTPIAVHVTIESSGFVLAAPAITAKDGTTFTVEFRKADGTTFSAGNSITVCWSVIG